MKFYVPLLAAVGLVLGAGQADAASCSTFVVIKSFDAKANTVEVSHEKGNEKRFFPRPEGSPSDTTKTPKKCASRMKRQTSFPITLTGGRMTVTQVRSNFEGKMLNDTNDPAWLPAQLKKLIDGKTEVMVVLRPGRDKKDPADISTIYLPITPEEQAEIARIDAQAEDVE